MKKELFVGVISILFIVGFVAAEKGGKGNGMNHLYLYEKCPEGEPCPWYNPDEWGTAWGKLTFSDYGYNFRGYGLAPNTDYTLIRYTDPWPGTPVICLTQYYDPEADNSKATDKNGKLHTTGVWETVGGNKVWLVLSADVDCEAEKMIGWNPTEYLFENNLI